MMYASFISATFILIVLSLAYCQSDGFRPIRYRNCKSNFELLTVEAAGCPGKTNHCPFKRGSEPRIRIGFKPTRDVRELETSVRAKLGAVFVPFNLEEKNACIGGNLTCPLKAGQTYYYSQSVKILHEYPKGGRSSQLASQR
uniref:Heh-1 n=1 Tax=Ascaris suum TaxID=6253 RepID=F1LBE9_ASCSU